MQTFIYLLNIYLSVHSFIYLTVLILSFIYWTSIHSFIYLFNTIFILSFMYSIQYIYPFSFYLTLISSILLFIRHLNILLFKTYLIRILTEVPGFVREIFKKFNFWRKNILIFLANVTPGYHYPWVYFSKIQSDRSSRLASYS